MNLPIESGRGTGSRGIVAWVRIHRSRAIVAGLLAAIAVAVIARHGVDEASEAAIVTEPHPAMDGAEEIRGLRRSATMIGDEGVANADPDAALADLQRYLSGENTTTVQCGTRREEMVLRAWEERYQALGEPGIVVFWEPENEDRSPQPLPTESRRGRLCLDGETVDGWIELERIDGDWFVVGAEAAPERR